MSIACLQDPPGYFEGRFLVYKPDIPSEMLRRAVPPRREHPMQTRDHIAPQFELIHHQLKQVCTVLGLALALFCTFGLPPQCDDPACCPRRLSACIVLQLVSVLLCCELGV